MPHIPYNHSIVIVVVVFWQTYCLVYIFINKYISYLSDYAMPHRIQLISCHIWFSKSHINKTFLKRAHTKHALGPVSYSLIYLHLCISLHMKDRMLIKWTWLSFKYGCNKANSMAFNLLFISVDTISKSTLECGTASCRITFKFNRISGNSFFG